MVFFDIIGNFIIQKLKSKQIYKLSKTNMFSSRFEGTRGEKTQIFRTIEEDRKIFDTRDHNLHRHPHRWPPRTSPEGI